MKKITLTAAALLIAAGNAFAANIQHGDTTTQKRYDVAPQVDVTTTSSIATPDWPKSMEHGHATTQKRYDVAPAPSSSAPSFPTNLQHGL